MERRSFLRGALAIFGAAAAGATLMTGQAEAAALDPKTLPAAAEPEIKDAEQVAQADTKELDAEGQYYYYRRPRRVYYRRRVYRPRRVYYRPRRVYYRPRRVFYRRRYFW